MAHIRAYPKLAHRPTPPEKRLGSFVLKSKLAAGASSEPKYFICRDGAVHRGPINDDRSASNLLVAAAVADQILVGEEVLLAGKKYIEITNHVARVVSSETPLTVFSFEMGEMKIALVFKGDVYYVSVDDAVREGFLLMSTF